MRGKWDLQNEVDVIAKERAHNERKYAAGKGKQKHVHGSDFILQARIRRRYRSRDQLDTYHRKRFSECNDEPADAYHGDVCRQERDRREEM